MNGGYSQGGSLNSAIVAIVPLDEILNEGLWAKSTAKR